MGANIAGIYGAQIFRSDDKPKYRRGFTINIVVLSIGLGLAILRFFDDKIWRRSKVAQIEDQLARENGNDSNSDEKSGSRTPDHIPTHGLEKTSPVELNAAVRPTHG
jgi:hypothetical protein